MPELFIMCGIPGSGKSTWAKKHLGKYDKYISRDDVRFSIISNKDEYFSKENEVFEEFCRQINKNLRSGYNVFADATHTTRSGRKKLMDKIIDGVETSAIVIDTPLAIAVERNSKRTGRKLVPTSAINNMYHHFEFPTHREGFKTIYRVVSDDEPIQIIKSYKED